MSRIEILQKGTIGTTPLPGVKTYEKVLLGSEVKIDADVKSVIDDVVQTKYMEMLRDYMQHNYDLSIHNNWSKVVSEIDAHVMVKERENGYFTIMFGQQQITPSTYIISIVGLSPGLDAYFERPLLNIYYNLILEKPFFKKYEFTAYKVFYPPLLMILFYCMDLKKVPTEFTGFLFF